MSRKIKGHAKVPTELLEEALRYIRTYVPSHSEGRLEVIESLESCVPYTPEPGDLFRDADGDLYFSNSSGAYIGLMAGVGVLRRVKRPAHEPFKKVELK